MPFVPKEPVKTIENVLRLHLQTQEEKKEEPIKVKFKQNKMLVAAENAFIHYLSAIESNVDKHSSNPVHLNDFVRRKQPKSKLDASNEKLIVFFEWVMAVIKKSQDGKKLTGEDLIENSSDIAALIIKIDAYLSDLCKDHTDLWNYLLSCIAGRHALYYLIYIDMVHTKADLKLWRTTFLKDKSHPEESSVLEYFYLLLTDETDPLKSNPLGDVSSISNPLIQADAIFHTFKTPDIKIQELLSLSKLKLRTKGIPELIFRMIEIRLANAMAIKVDLFLNDINQFPLVCNQLVDKEYLPKALLITKPNQSSMKVEVFLSIYRLYQYVKVVNENYSVSNHYRFNLFIEMADSIVFSNICLHEKLDIEDKNSHIDMAVFKNLTLSAFDLLKNIDCETLPEIGQYYWPVVTKFLCSFTTDTIILEKLNETIGELFQKKNENDAVMLLTCFINAYDIYAANSTKNILTDHHILLSAIKLIQSLPDHDTKKSKNDSEAEQISKDFIVLLNEVGNDKYQFYKLTPTFLSTFKNLKIELRMKLVRKMEPLQAMIGLLQSSEEARESLPKLNEVVSQLLSSLDKEEKKPTPTQVVFKPDAHLTAIEDYLLLYFRSIETAMQGMSLVSPPFPNRPEKVKVDEENDFLIDLYNQIIELLQLSQDVKASKKSIGELVEATKMIYKKIYSLKENHPMLWEYFLRKTAGRHVLYYLLFVRIIHKEPDLQITRFLIDSLYENCSDTVINTSSEGCEEPQVEYWVKESDVLEYVEFLLPLLGITDTEKPENLYNLNNILILTHVIFCSKKENTTNLIKGRKDIEDKIQTVRTIIKVKLQFNTMLPGFIPQLMQSIYAKLFIDDISTCASDIPIFLSLMQGFTVTHYFPAILAEMRGNTLPDAIGKFFNFSQFLEVFYTQYALVNYYKSTILHQQHHSLTFLAVSLFEEVTQLGNIANHIVQNLAYSAFHLLNNDLVGPDKCDKFIKAMVKMLSLAGQSIYLTEINKMVDHFFAQGKINIAKSILAHLISRKDRVDKTKYVALLSMFDFISDLDITHKHDQTVVNANRADLTVEDDIKQFQAILDNVKNNKYHFDSLMNTHFIRDKFKFLQNDLRVRLIELMQDIKLKNDFMNLSSKNESFLIFQKTVIQYAEILNLDPAELNKIKSDIRFNDAFCFDDAWLLEETKKTPPEKNKKKGAKKIKKPVLTPKSETAKTIQLIPALTVTKTVQSTATIADTPTAKQATKPKAVPAVKSIKKSKVAPTAKQAATDAPKIQSITTPSIAKTVKSTVKIVSSLTAKPPTIPAVQLENTSTDKSETKNEYSKLALTPLVAQTLFKRDDIDDLIIARDQLPSAILDLANEVYQATKKNLFLTGGSIIYLYNQNNQKEEKEEKEENPYDWDFVICCHKSNLLPSLSKSKKYACTIRGRHEIIHLLMIIQECDLLLVELPPNINNLHELPIKSDAAYIRTPNSFFYINKAKNVCMEWKLSPEKLKAFDEEMKPTANAVTLEEEDLKTIKHITRHVHVRSLKGDITCLKDEGNELEVVKDDLNQRDLTPAALCVMLSPTATKYLIQGTKEAIVSLRNRIISPVNSEAIFFDDLIQLFRLGKMRLKHPNFTMDKMLTDLIEIDNGKYIDILFNNFIFHPQNRSENLTHLRQIGTKLDELFSRFNTGSVIRQLHELHIISGMTGIKNVEDILATTHILDVYLETLPENSKKTGFYYFIYIHASLSKDPNFKMQLLQQVGMTLAPNGEQDNFGNHLNFINRETSFRMLNQSPQGVFKPSQHFRNLLLDLKICHVTKTAQRSQIQNSPIQQTPSYNRSLTM